MRSDEKNSIGVTQSLFNGLEEIWFSSKRDLLNQENQDWNCRTQDQLR